MMLVSPTKRTSSTLRPSCSQKLFLHGHIERQIVDEHPVRNPDHRVCLGYPAQPADSVDQAPTRQGLPACGSNNSIPEHPLSSCLVCFESCCVQPRTPASVVSRCQDRHSFWIRRARRSRPNPMSGYDHDPREHPVGGEHPLRVDHQESDPCVSSQHFHSDNCQHGHGGGYAHARDDHGKR